MKHSSRYILNLLGEILTLFLIFCYKGCKAKTSGAYSEWKTDLASYQFSLPSKSWVEFQGWLNIDWPNGLSIFVLPIYHSWKIIVGIPIRIQISYRNPCREFWFLLKLDSKIPIWYPKQIPIGIL